MDRRKFLQRGLAGAAGAGLISACGGGAGEESAAGPAVHTRKSVTWRLASSFPRSLDTIYGAAEVLADRVEAMSEGKFRIRCYPAGEIVPAVQVMDAAQQGTVQIGHTASYYFIGKNQALAFDCCVPFGMTSRQQAAWLIEGGGLELMRGVFADFGLTTFPAGNTGTQMGGWFNREINGPGDLKGLRMRIPGLGGQVMDRLGATVQLLAGGEIYPALERGAIDATEWVGPYDDEKLGFHKVAKYYYYPGWWEPGPSLSYHVNLAAWAELPVAYQEIFATAASESATVMQARYDQRNPAALARLLAEGVEMRPFSDDLMRAARDASFEMLEEHASADATYRKIYQSWKQARSDAYRWFGTAELAYSRFAFGDS
ncbi:MAG: TRAP transporter substrate-binding protein [bacterium]|nr:TRAP transporter substrate-binding protein [bacterium]